MKHDQTNQTKRSRDISARKKTVGSSLFDDDSQQSSSIQARDYVNAFVVNEENQVLVLEGTDNGRSWSSWKMIGRELRTDEDPILAVQQELLLRTGHTSEDWIYLGTFVVDERQEVGAGHFFCANVLVKTKTPDETYSIKTKPKWVTKRKLKQALMDGRIAVINHAVAASLAMVMCNDNK